MTSTDVLALVANLEKLSISPSMTEEDAAKSMSFFGDFNGNMLGVVYFSGETPWERHPAGDELLYVLEGDIDLTILSADKRQREVVGAGSVCVVPKGLWHRQQSKSGAKLFFSTPSEGNENSWSEDPRKDAGAA